MGYKQGKDMQQLSFLCLDDYVPHNHICRAIYAFVTGLDMIDLNFKYAQTKDVGAPPFDPRAMLMLYIYGYLNRVRSSRRLEAETLRNVEVMWLMAGLLPDNRTICEFRKNNAKVLKAVFKQFVLLCKGIDLLGGVTVATDGTKFRANCSKKNIMTKSSVERELSHLDKLISEYMNELEKNDAAETNEDKPDANRIEEIIKGLKAKKEDLESYTKRLETEKEISVIDPDAKLMKSGGDARKIDACYNVITVVDDKNKLIVDFDVTKNPNDLGQLHDISIEAKEILETGSLKNLADSGFYSGKDIDACERDGITCLVAKPAPGGKKKEEGFTRESFIYNKENDYYVCPNKKRLQYKRLKVTKGKLNKIYSNYSACTNCPKKTKCTERKFREIERSIYQDTLDIIDERTKNNKALYRRRQEIVEHPFGTVKAVWGYKQFLCRTLPKVAGETSLAYLAYNFRRVFNILNEQGRDITAAIQQYFLVFSFILPIITFLSTLQIKTNFKLTKTKISSKPKANYAYF